MLPVLSRLTLKLVGALHLHRAVVGTSGPRETLLDETGDPAAQRHASVTKKDAV